MNIEAVRQDLQTLSDKNRARLLQHIFKTGPGEYGEGDVFLGVRVPHIRKLANKYKGVPVSLIIRLLRSAHHEERLLALLLLKKAYINGDEKMHKKIYDLYLANTAYINNWDLVDISASHIVGSFLYDKSRTPLYTLAGSHLLWERRIAVIATFYFIRRYDYDDFLALARMLLHDGEDLIQKAVGWMLREVGKRHRIREETFLKKHYRNMPRTMLRYAIERFPENKRKAYLKGKI